MHKILYNAFEISAAIAILHGTYTIHPGFGWITLGIFLAAMAHDLKKSI